MEDVFSYLDVIGKLTEVIERIECETMRLLSRRIVLRLFSEEAATLIQQLRRKAAILSTQRPYSLPMSEFFGNLFTVAV